MDQLRETALVGTEKKPLDITGLPDAVQQLLVPSDPESQFLQAVTLLNFYGLAGRYPAEYKGTVDESSIEEEKSVASRELLDLYPKFEMVDHQLRDSVQSLWLKALIDYDRIVSPEILVSLVRDGKGASQSTKAKIVRVIGNKGAWILRNDPNISYPVVPSGPEAWMEGTTQDRKIIFTNLHALHPIGGIELLQRTWSTESVVTKKVFLELLRQNCVPSDAPFVEALYGEEFRFQPKEKKTERECRRLLAGMMLSLTTTPLYAQVTKGLDQYFIRPRKGILGYVTGKESVSFQLPDTEDNFWSARSMDELFGFEAKNFDIALFNSPQLYWLSCLLELLPMSYWAKHFDGEYSRSVEYWLTHEDFRTTVDGESIAIFRSALIENAQAHHDSALAWVLTSHLNAREVIVLLPALEPRNFEAFVRKKKYWDDVEILGNGPFNQESSWSLAFSEHVIEQAYEQAMRNKSSSALGKVIAQYAHPDSIDALYRYNEKARESSAYNVWNTSIFQVAHAAMEIRCKINAIKKQTA